MYEEDRFGPVGNAAYVHSLFLLVHVLLSGKTELALRRFWF